jgi:hypothetical protein
MKEGRQLRNYQIYKINGIDVGGKKKRGKRMRGEKFTWAGKNPERPNLIMADDRTKMRNGGSARSPK